MKHKIPYRCLSVLLAVMLVFAAFPISLQAEDEFSVVISMEGLTLGQGFYVEPEIYTLSEINTILAEAGYGPYTEEDLTAGMVTLAMLLDHRLEYENTGDWESNVYLSAVAGVDKGYVNIPEIITENGGPSNEDYEENTDEYLGEFDYASMSGWMVTVNDFMINVGIGNYPVADGSVIRWQFTLWGYGADLGVSTGWGADAFFEGAERAALYTAYAKCQDAEAKAAARSVMEELQATQESVDAATAALNAVNTPVTPAAPDAAAVLSSAMAKLAETIPAPTFGTLGGEWTVLTLARGGYYAADSTYFASYYDRIVETVNEQASAISPATGALHKVKSTENSRLILALSAIGKDARSVGDWNLLAPFEDFSWIKKQGINGPIFALIALDTQNYPTEDTTIRQQCMDYILEKQLSDGGWALSGSAADPDITAMALQALAKYQNQQTVAEAGARAFACLSSMQRENGGYASWGSINSESIAQVIVACTAWGINPHTDERFIKNGSSALDALLTFYIADESAFCHVADDSANAMATDQACYALVAYQRFVGGQKSLYDMTDTPLPLEEAVHLSASLSLPEKVEHKAGTAFNAVVNLSGWQADVGYKLMDCIITVPAELEVSGVTMGNRVGGGQLCYHLEESTGKLRIVYFDPQNGSDLSVSGVSFPAEFLTVHFTVKEDVDVKTTNTLTIAISGMSFKKNAKADEADAMTIVSLERGSDTTQVVKGITFSYVNAQDALNCINYWLRKTEVPDETAILTVNINADARLNTFDALGIVSYFVDGTEFEIVNAAATLKSVID